MGLVSLGKVTVASAGTPVQVNAQATNFARCRTLCVSTAGNTGVVYLGFKGMNKSTGAGVLAVFQKDQYNLFGDEGAGLQFDTSDLYLDAATNGDSAIFSYFG